MSNPFVFGPTKAATNNRYQALGFKRNPFVPQDDDETEGPFYTKHLTSQVAMLLEWASESLEKNVPALALKGTIGAGKTRVLRALKHSLMAARIENKIHVEHVFLNRAGYSRPNVAGFILGALETFKPDWSLANCPTCPITVMPIVWAIAHSDLPPKSSRLVGIYMTKLQQSNDKEHNSEVLTRWFRRDSISASQGRSFGIIGRLDAEGTHILILSDLLRVAKECGVLNKLFLFVDQLEDLMRPSYSELRKSRILEDLRSLIDYIDEGAPIGLILSWSPEIDYGNYVFRMTNVDQILETTYMAFYSRARRKMVQLDNLGLTHAPEFAEQYAEFAKVDANASVSVNDIVVHAWTNLKETGLISAERATPRDFLKALQDEVDKRAPVATPQ